MRALAGFLEAIEEAQVLDRHRVWDRAAEQFDIERMVDGVVAAMLTGTLEG